MVLIIGFLIGIVILIVLVILTLLVDNYQLHTLTIIKGNLIVISRITGIISYQKYSWYRIEGWEEAEEGWLWNTLIYKKFRPGSARVEWEIERNHRFLGNKIIGPSEYFEKSTVFITGRGNFMDLPYAIFAGQEEYQWLIDRAEKLYKEARKMATRIKAEQESRANPLLPK